MGRLTDRFTVIAICLLAGYPSSAATAPSPAASGPSQAFSGPALSAPILQGPGLPNQAWLPGELFKPVYTFHATAAADASKHKGINHVAMINGWLFVPYGEDSGSPGGGISFWDISNPRKPAKVFARDVEELREAHGFGFHIHEGRTYVAMQSGIGVMFWDITDVANPVKLVNFKVENTEFSDYDHPNWWTMWQAPYVFMGRGEDGISIADARDPAKPVLLSITSAGATRKNLPISSMGNFKVGPTFVIGNLMVVTNMGLEQNPGYATVDVSDPQNPKLLGTDLDHNCYSTFVNGNRILCGGSGGMEGRLIIHDISDPTRIRKVGESVRLGYKGEYHSIQDEFVHIGIEDRYAKVDVSDPANMKVIQKDFELKDGGQEGFCEPLGNLVMITDDHGAGSELVPHQAAPDTRPPVINMQSPAKGAVRQHIKSRVGFTFTDQIDVASVNGNTFMVYALGKPPLKGYYSSQISIVNFTPEQPLEPNTTYEVYVPKGGIRDYAGNPVDKDFSFRFSTGASVDSSTSIRPGGPVGKNRDLRASLQADGSILFTMKSLEGAAMASACLSIVDLTGRKVQTLAWREPSLDRREAAFRWDRTRADGRAALSGLYIAVLEAGSSAWSERFFLP